MPCPLHSGTARKTGDATYFRGVRELAPALVKARLASPAHSRPLFDTVILSAAKDLSSILHSRGSLAVAVFSAFPLCPLCQISWLSLRPLRLCSRLLLALAADGGLRRLVARKVVAGEDAFACLRKRG